MDGDSIYIASELRLRSLFFVEVGAAIIVESTIVPFSGSVLLLRVALPPVKKAFPAARFLRWQSFFTAPRSVVY